MIKIQYKNFSTIKKYHEYYFNMIVIPKIEEELNKATLEEKKILKKMFYLNNSIDKNIMNTICYGERKDLLKIVNHYNDLFSYETKLINDLDIYIRNIDYYTSGDTPKRETDFSNLLNQNYYTFDKLNYSIVLDIIKFSNKRELKKQIRTIKNNIIKFEKIDNILKRISSINNILKKIFSYDDFKKSTLLINDSSKSIKWNRHTLISMSGINVCPYCNRQYISSYIDKNNDLKTTADLDHYYSQSKYPFLALSLYNFIPSCQICNSRFKLSVDFFDKDYIYPYEESFGSEASFTTEFYTEHDTYHSNSTDFLSNKERYDISYLLGNSENFKIKLDINDKNCSTGKKIVASSEVFKIEELYNFHKDYVRELIKKAIIYNESRIDEIYNNFSELYENREEVIRMVVGNYICEEELGKRPLAKLTKDICEELGLK